ncbi:MAG: N-acetylmuramoyl-L-alanine amidase [Geminicoccaceae bacterium]
MRLVERPSPNCDARPGGAAIDMLVLHYTGMPTAAVALDRLLDPAAKVSAHYVIDEDGSVVAMVPERQRAWHAGVSWWQGRGALNDVSLGIELVNPGHEWGYRPFPGPQMAALVELAVRLTRRWQIAPDRVVAHSDIAPARKEDPGELFEWQCLAAEGLCLAAPSAAAATADPDLAAAALSAFGYPGAAQGVPPAMLWRAFQRRWRPACCDGVLDDATTGLALAVAGLRAGSTATR